jgi:membrane-associated phospholipid phosphatase
MKHDRRFWAVDKVILTYFACSVLLILGWWSKLPQALPLLAANVIGGAVIVYQVKRPNVTSWLFRNWYALPYVASCYKEMALFIPVVRSSDADQWLADLDFRIWGAHPSVWLERVHTPVFTEFLQIVYTLFVPAVLYIAVVLWRRRRTADFQYYAFLIALGFLASYLGYILVPARGPRFLLKHLQHFPLQGLWLFQTMQNALDRLESAHYDCFPSGHTELTILAWWGSRMVSRRLSRVYLAYTPCIIFATVYLRYHYTVDLLAGMITAAVLILTAPRLYQKLSPKGL